VAKTIRDVMTQGAECIREDQTVIDAAKRLAQLDVGALPICGSDDRVKGMLTDRDIVVKVLAQGKDPASVRASELEQGGGQIATISPDDSVDDALRAMKENAVRRLPVTENDHLVGIISQADLAKEISEKKVGDLVEAISAAP
jgi:CBS domain-containing protein